MPDHNTRAALRKCRTCGDVYPEDGAHPCDGGSDPYAEALDVKGAMRMYGLSGRSVADLDDLRARLAGVERERDAAHEYVAKLTEENVRLLRWMSVATGAHLDHLCNMVKSLAGSEGLASLRAISADGVVDEIRRAFAAERIGRELSEDACQRLRGELAKMEGRALNAERERDEALKRLRAAPGDISAEAEAHMVNATFGRRA